MVTTILVVDDDVDVAETVARTLQRANFETLIAYRGADALQTARERRPDLVVLDIKMPGLSGIEVCRMLRATPDLSRVPVLFLSARSEVNDRLEGFEAGADDYITKPFDLRELELRVKALLRRTRQAEGAAAGQLRVGPIALDARTFELRTPERSVLLTPVEYDLMQFLMRHPGQVFSAALLLQEVWGYPPGMGTTDLVRVHVRNLREKIEPDPHRPRYIRNIPRRGYSVAVDQ
ncbi:MAG TPA: response regulator transcription factor [Anaerolineae bacterium]|nr:response regulator transcription factor [Anaerolineae bacterium]HOQ97560.1 response regulator transcription factor [Anaerolineae bacterium]HPL29905.1 response regulator transcription factor [Anaerolineae bacterium]